MKNLRDRLKEDDPVAVEPPLSDLDAQRMRRSIAAAAEDEAIASRWGRKSWTTATAVVAITVAIGVSRWFETRDRQTVSQSDETTLGPSRDPVPSGVEGVVPTVEGRRQLQFIAPGGTRVIWVFNEDFRP